MNDPQYRRLVEVELAVARLATTDSESIGEDVDEASLRAAWRRLRALPEPPPRPLPPDIAALSDVELVEAWRRLCRGGER